MISALSFAYGWIAPFVGPVIAWIIPKWARAKLMTVGIGSAIGPLVGLAVVAATIGIGAAVISHRREVLRSEGEARCSSAVSGITIKRMRAEQLRAQRADAAAAAARDDADRTGRAFMDRMAALEAELSIRPPKGVCFPADLARKLNQ